MKKPTNKAEPGIPPGQFEDDSSASRSTSGARLTAVFKHILVAIDFSETASNALDYASALAQRFHSDVTLLHVVEPTVYAPNVLLGSPQLDEPGERLLTSARERLKKLKQRAGVHSLTIEALVRMGRAQSDITDTAKAIGADLIVMGTHGHSGPRQSFMGGTAEKVLRSSACPVLAVPPTGAAHREMRSAECGVK